MSVAFRRESDEEHLEPAFELPIPPGPNLVTARGLALIEARLSEIEGRIAALSDADEIKAARRHLRYWSTRRSTARLMPPASGEAVAFGTRVHFRLKGQARTISIVGDDEADPTNDRLSFSAPLARAMMDAEPGETVDFAGAPDAIEILAVETLGN